MKFKRIITERLLQERQILFDGGADYNQAVFMAGGTASGKGYAAKKFMQGEKFRTFDVDRWKEGYLELQKQTGRFPELEGLDLENPQDVSKLHHFVKEKGIHNRFVNNVLMNAEPGRLPNVMFDVTLKEVDKLHKFLPMLKASGYEPRNIHLVWVLANYDIALKRNRDRKRIVPDDILLHAHEGAAGTVTDLIERGLPPGMDGAVHVILNNPEHTVFFADEQGDPIEVEGTPPGGGEAKSRKVIKDFQYLTLKEAGKPFRDVLEVKETLAQWIKRNAPRTVETWKSLSAMERP
jgi:dephospho-CoA kinase